MSEVEVGEDPKYKDNPGREEAKSVVEEAKKKLDKLHFTPVRQAFMARCIRFGLDPRNIWGANPVDLMHAFQSGILMYLVKMVLDKLPTKKQAQLDKLVHKLFHCLRSNERHTYPRMNFTKGFSKLTMLTSDEWAGKLFVILVVLHTEEGRKLFKDAKTFEANGVELPPDFKENFKKDAEYLESAANNLDQILRPLASVEKEVYKVIPMTEEEEDKQQKELEKKKKGKQPEEEEEMARKCSATDFTELAEALLCFHAWYKMGVLKVREDGKINTSVIRTSVARMLGMVRWYCPRKKGKGWKLQKFHDILHLAMDIERFGHPSNFDAGPMESGLKYWAKLPALTAQMRGYNTFVKQVAWRTFEFQCFAKALRKNGIAGTSLQPKPSPHPQEDEEEVDEANDNEEEKDGEELVEVQELQPELVAAVEAVGEEHKEAKDSVKLKGTRYRVYASPPDGVHPNTGKPGLTIYKPSQAFINKKNQGGFVVSPVIENYLRFQPKEDHEKLPWTSKNDERYWDLRTEATIALSGSGKKVSLRCHPNYRNEGPWYDWVIVHFETDEAFEDLPADHRPQYQRDCVPCKILAFAEHQPKGSKKTETWILVHGCNFRKTENESKMDSCLLEHWELAYHDLSSHIPADGSGDNEHYWSPVLNWIKPESILCRCLVVEEEPGIFENVPMAKSKTKKTEKPSNKVLLIKQRRLWPLEFTS
jgi:hypothetical protein